MSSAKSSDQLLQPRDRDDGIVGGVEGPDRHPADGRHLRGIAGCRENDCGCRRFPPTRLFSKAKLFALRDVRKWDATDHGVPASSRAILLVSERRRVSVSGEVPYLRIGNRVKCCRKRSVRNAGSERPWHFA